MQKKRLRKETKSWAGSFWLILLVLFVATSLSSCGIFEEAPDPAPPAVKFESLKRLEKGEKMPYDGWSLNDEDYQTLLEILAELERKSDQ